MIGYAAARPSPGSGRPPLSVGFPALFLACLTLWGVCVPSARAQQRERPSLGYLAAFSQFYEGEYVDALKMFRGEAGGGVKTPQARWIDSICYETMVGECYYQMGRLSEALDHYTAAVQLYVAYSDWMTRVRFSPTIRPSSTQVRIPWGVSSRRSRRGHYPRSVPVLVGQIDQNRVAREGGIAWQAQLLPIQVSEIVRCTVLAVRRRNELMGPASRHSELTVQLVAALSRRPGPPNHWSEAWIDLQQGLALLAGGKEAQAMPYLQRSVAAAGEFDHPLTATALMELGRLAMARASYPAALKLFEEATYSAAFYGDYGVLEESFRRAALAHLLSGRKGVYPPLVAAIQWAKVENLRQLQASLLISAAENQAVLGQTRQAAELLEQAAAAVGRREMGAGRIGARLQFIKSLVCFQAKKIDEGGAALAVAMDYMKQGSIWVFQIALADRLYADGPLGDSPRVALELYNELLRDPQPADWTSDPMESLAMLLTPHRGPIERWFEVALKRKEHEKALEIADRARRHEYFSSLGFGGRLQSLRWILQGPVSALDKTSQLHRQELLAAYPAFDQLSRQAQAVRTALQAMPLVAGDRTTLKAQSQKLAELAAVSLQQETLLREIAVRRHPAGLVFPPLRETKEVQKALPRGHAVLAFFATSRGLYGFLMNNKQYAYWQVASPEVLNRRIVELLRNMGHYQQNHELTLKELGDPTWKKSAQAVLDAILRGSRADFTQQLDELAIVPDGLLWYVPFEALQVDVDGRLRPLISRFRIRYAPTVSLAVPGGHPRRPSGNTAVVVGRLFPRSDETAARAAFDQLSGVIPGTVALGSPMPASSDVYASLFDRLIVLDDLNFSAGGPYDWAPVPIDRGQPGNSLGDWLPLPLRGPQEIILPGYHTAAEDSLKGLNRATAGKEMFLSVCGLLSSGARTVLLSRWRTGGRTSFDLVREFAQELPHTSPADAWQRAVFLTAGSRLKLDEEPRIKRTITDDSPKANHPFFWAGLALIDSGTTPKPPEDPPDKAALKKQKPDQPQLQKKDPKGRDQPELRRDGPRPPQKPVPENR